MNNQRTGYLFLFTGAFLLFATYAYLFEKVIPTTISVEHKELTLFFAGIFILLGFTHLFYLKFNNNTPIIKKKTRIY